MIVKIKCIVVAVLISIGLPLEAQKNMGSSTLDDAEFDCIILLHGLARTASSMKKLEKALISEGYRVVNLSYPSRRLKVEELAETYIAKALSECSDKAKSVNFVTHSMGGILVRQYLQQKTIYP